MNQKERVRTKRAVDYGRACRRRVPELPYPVSKRNRFFGILAMFNPGWY